MVDASVFLPWPVCFRNVYRKNTVPMVTNFIKSGNNVYYPSSDTVINWLAFCKLNCTGLAWTGLDWT